MFKKFKFHFIYNKAQRREILVLLLVVIAGLIGFRSISHSEENIIDSFTPEILSLIREVDSLKEIQKELGKPAFASFNPNYLTDYRGYTLGMSSEEIERLLDFRKQGNWINSIQEFRKVTKISDSLLATISDQFKFPEWVSTTKNNASTFIRNENREKSYVDKIDLNVATAEDLRKIRGIGEVLSERIINYRTKLDGFATDLQLHEVYGLEDEVIQRVLKQFTVKTPKEIKQINVNTATASDLSTVPGIYFDLAKEIWEYRTLRGGLDSIQELLKVKGMTEPRFKQIQLYLTLDKEN